MFCNLVWVANKNEYLPLEHGKCKTTSKQEASTNSKFLVIPNLKPFALDLPFSRLLSAFSNSLISTFVFIPPRVQNSGVQLYTWYQSAYPYLLSLSVRHELVAPLAVRHRVRLDKLVGIVTSLGADSFHSGLGSQVNLQPLLIVIVLGNPASSSGAMVPRLEPRTPGTVVVVVHGRSREHRWGDTAILKTEGNITWICTKQRKSWRWIDR